jgi:hypothetical protein
MHTSEILRSDQFQVRDAQGHTVDLTHGLRDDDRLGIVSPRYEDGVTGAGAAILLFVTAYYDLQRRRRQETGEDFFIYADYYAFLFADGENVRGASGPAPLDGAVSSAYSWLDIWPQEKWVVVADTADLWRQVQTRGITHLLMPVASDKEIGAVPPHITAQLRAIIEFARPGQSIPPNAASISMGEQPAEVVAEAIRRLPPESPAHGWPQPSVQYVVPSS